MALPTIVLIHGGWHFPGYFDKVRAILDAKGYKTVAPAMPGVGRSPPVQSLDEDIATVRSTVLKELEAGHDVVLNAHSWGGIPTSCAMEGLSKSERKEQGHANGVLKMTFVSSFVLPEGVSLVDANGGAPPPWTELQEDGTIVAHDVLQNMYHDCDPKEAEEIISKLRPLAFATVVTKTSYAPWKKIPSAYLVCENDRTLPVQGQEAMIEGVRQQGGEIDVERIAFSHSPYIGKPESVAEFILRAAAEKTAD